MVRRVVTTRRAFYSCSTKVLRGTSDKTGILRVRRSSFAAEWIAFKQQRQECEKRNNENDTDDCMYDICDVRIRGGSKTVRQEDKPFRV